MRRAIQVSVCVVVLAALSGAQSLTPAVKMFVKTDAPVIALTHVRVIDGTGATARENQTVVLSHGKIDSVGDAATVTVPSGAQVMDFTGDSVIPGLVGMHDHLFYPMGDAIFGEMGFSFPRLYLAAGVTTIRTGGALEPYTDLEIKKAIDSGAMVGPHMHVTGPYLEGPGSFAVQMHAITSPADAVKTVNFWLDQGVDNFKAYNFITPEELGAAIVAAHKRGAKVTGHLCSIGFREAAALGMDDLEHGITVDTEFFPWKKKDVCESNAKDDPFIAGLDISSQPVKDMIEDLVKHHVAVTSTLPVFELEVPGRPAIQPRVLEALSPDARNAFLNNKVRMGDAARIQRIWGTNVSPLIGVFKKEMEFEYAFVKAGGTLIAGEDPTGIGGDLAGFGDQREVELLVEAGFTPVEAIKIATLNGAQYMGDDHIGSIATGKNADLVVVKGDPSKKIEDIENVEIVFKDGVGYGSGMLIDSVRGKAGLR